MTNRAALVTGASSGIGFGIAEALARARYGVTLVARRPEKLEGATSMLRADGLDVEAFAADLTEEQAITQAVKAHESRYGRLDVLVNNAGIGIGQYVDDVTTKMLDRQFATNLRATILFYREATPLLRRAAAERGVATVVNVASYSGVRGEAWLGVYSAVKRGIVGYTQAMNRELHADGIRSTALCPAFVDTPMTEFLHESFGPQTMIQVRDISDSVLFVVGTSRGCVIPEIQFEQPGGVELPLPPRTPAIAGP